MNAETLKRRSKLLSLVLRHRPEYAGVSLDSSGWVAVKVLLDGLRSKGRGMSVEQLRAVVQENDKQRFEFSEDGNLIRARQGHSVNVELGYEESKPPKVLHHGTPEQFVNSIRREGLRKQKRHHVHLHQDSSLASSVGSRRGKPVLLVVEAQRMYEAGHKFYVTGNRVWLTDHVPAEFIHFPGDVIT